ncbi:MAG: DUF327 family protein [Leptospiraceae bacterium]|nr:DUF327 family protein [Leptospiraceae bacterium]MCB1320621.1 DUF327 family protein [Leptospiraceae bacterium]
MQVRLTTDTDYRRNRTGKARTENRSGSATESRSPFQSLLEEVLPPDDNEAVDLHRLWEKLPDAERDFLANPTDAHLETYREVVKNIAAITLRRNTRVQKVKRRNRNGEMVELSVLEIIDERLQKMAHLMQSPGNSAFQLLKTVEEIRGILLDVRE